MKKLLHDMSRLLKGYGKQQFLGMILTMLCAGSTIAAPIVSSYLIDDVIPSQSVQHLIYGIIFFFIVCISNPMISYPRSKLYLNMTQKVTSSLREKLFEKVLFAPITFFEQFKSGEIVNRIINDSQQIGQFITNFFTNFILDFGLIVMAIIGMIYISPQISLIAIGVFLFAFLLNNIYRKRMIHVSASLQQDYDILNSDITQTVHRIETLKSYTLESTMLKNYIKHVKSCQTNTVIMNRYFIKMNTFMQGVYVICTCLMYSIGAYKIMQQEMSLGNVIALNLLFQNFITPIYRLSNNIAAIHQNIPILDRIIEFLDLAEEVQGTDKSATQPLLSGPIKINNLGFQYKEKEKWIIEDLSLTLPENGLIGVIGDSGSGKSTFVKLLLRFYQPQEGNIVINNRALCDIELAKLRKSISYVSQDVSLFNVSIRENIMAYQSNISEEQMIDLCKKLQIHDRIMSLPEQYDSIVNERINLSGGEKQRIGIARALAKSVHIYIFDEPTNSLDLENSKMVKKIIEDLSEKHLVILIEHKLDAFEHATKLYQFREGKLWTRIKENKTTDFA